MTKVILNVGEPVNLEETELEKTARLAEEESAKNKPDDDKKSIVDDVKPANPANNVDSANTVVLLDENNVEVTYSLNATGDALNEDGTILYTSAQLKEFEVDDSADDDDTFVQIRTLSGIKVLDASGAEIEYPNTVEGLAQREVDIKNTGIYEGQSKAITKFFEENPDFESMYNYKKVHKTLEGYNSFTDYSKVTIDPNNKESLIKLIVDAEVAKGTPVDRAQRIAKFSVAEDTLLKDAQDSKTFLETIQTAKVKAANDEETERMNSEIQKENDYFGVAYQDGKEIVLNVKDSIYDLVVTKGVIGGISIPKDGLTVKDAKGTIKHLDRKQIFDYISKPVAEDNGTYYTQAQIDELNRLANKGEVIGTYIRNLLGGDMSQLIEVGKRNDAANAIRKIKVKSANTSNAKNNTSGSLRVKIPVK